MGPLDPELCPRCLDMFRSREDDRKQAGKLFSFFDDDMDNFSPESCPVCAMVHLDASSRGFKEISNVNFAFGKEDDGREYCELWYVSGPRWVWSLRLEILPGNETRTVQHYKQTLSCSTVTDESITFMAEQLATCLKHHDPCRTPVGAHPTRLLRLEQLHGGFDRVLLEDSDRAKSYTYITLSHCWGKSHPISLTEETEETLRAGLYSSDLPKTFRDAVYICLRLGYQYIWIDSLCIFQDDLQDWKLEAARMRSVYKNALLNLAASGASDSTVGLSFERNPVAVQPFRIDISPPIWVHSPDWPEVTVSESPLNKRAWVLQERLLSPRMVHFTAAGAVWDCMNHMATEVNQSGFPYKYREDIDRLRMFKRKLAGAVAEKTPVDATKMGKPALYYLDWVGLLSMYTRCGITQSTDKLVALQGVAQLMKEIAGVQLVCGMWGNLLTCELLWEVDHFDDCDLPYLPEWRAPTWSWANSDFKLTECSYPVTHWRCPNFEDLAKTTKLNVNAHPFGQVKDASLTVTGTYLRATVSRTLSSFSLESGADDFMPHGFLFRFDRKSSGPTWGATSEWTFVALKRCNCMVAKMGSETAKDVRPSLAALILCRCPTTPPTYNRIGILFFDGQEACDFYYRNQSAEAEDLVIL